jgi:hypothetical protein
MSFHIPPSAILINMCRDRYDVLPPFLQKSIRAMLDIITDTFTPQVGMQMFQNFHAHLLEFGLSLESSATWTYATWNPSEGAKMWESELNKVPELKQVYMNMIGLIMEGADSQDCVLDWFIGCIGMFDALKKLRNIAEGRRSVLMINPPAPNK